MQVDGKLNSARPGSEHHRGAEVLEQAPHGPVVRQHQRGEAREVLRTCAVCQAAQQGLPDAAALPGFENGQSDLGAVASFLVADVAGDAHADAAGRVCRDQRLAVRWWTSVK